MKNKLLLMTVSVLLLLSSSNAIYAQAPGLGTAANFVLFTVSGAVGNTGVSRIKGDIGTNSGAISNFGNSIVNGTIHNADAATAQCSSDLLAAYTELNAVTPDSFHIPVFGNGETLYPGVYAVPSAASVTAELTLDALGDSNAIFIFKIGGAFTTGAAATINLVNGAAASNVFWVAEGEIAMAALTSMKGTLIANNGAISLAAGGMLEGRMFSTAGAIAVDAVAAAIQLPFLAAPVLQVPDFGIAAGFVLYTVTGAVGNTGISALTGNIGTNVGAITGFDSTMVNGSVHNADAVTTQCSTDLLAAYDQLNVIAPTATHIPVLGNGETLYAGVYSLAAAGSITSTLTLDAQGNPNAIFIFKTGGAFTTAASATVNLVNGASACNVFWVAEGAIAMAALTSMRGTLISHNGAISMGAGGTLEGRMFSTAGAASVYNVAASIPVGCPVKNVWTGAAGTDDWFTASNWTIAVPDGIMETWIPSTLAAGRLFPLINTGVATVDTITVQTGGSLTITNAILQIKGTINNRGIVNARNGSIEMTGPGAQVISANTFEQNAVCNLIISNNSAAGVALAGALDLYGSLSYSGTGMKLITNDALTLKATASNTATIGDMTGNIITGEVTVEHYIPAHKAWRFLSIPTSTTQNIKQAWQEGATRTNSNPVNGYGTQITSEHPTWLADGFDLFSANGPSMKTFDPVSNTWTGVPNTNIQDIKTTNGYMTFIRGNRTANTFNSAPTETVLRTKGVLYTGDQPVMSAEAGQFTALGNPYPSVLDMRKIQKTGVKDFFYVWDPNLGSMSGYGAYQTFTFDGGNYIPVPGMGSYGATGTVNNYIQSGEAFLVQADSMGGTIYFDEGAKANYNSRTSSTASESPQLRVNLFGINSGNTYMADGLLISYDDNYNNDLDGMDAIKTMNSSENLSIKKANSYLVIEKRPNFISRDTIFLNLTGTRVQQYRFQFTAERWSQPGLTCMLEDKYLQTTTAVDLDGLTSIGFNIENVAASYAADRFRLVFSRPLITLPLSITSIKSFRENEHIKIQWTAEEEKNITKYNVQRSLNGTEFFSIATVTPTLNSSTSNKYQAADMHPVAGYNFYRVQAVGPDGAALYSAVVKTLFENENQALSVSPNPIDGKSISLQFNDMPAGVYTARLVDHSGRQLFEKFIQHEPGSKTELLTIDTYLAHGSYLLKLIQAGGKTFSMNLLY